MSMIIARPIDAEGRLDIGGLHKKYPRFLVEGAYVMCFANRVFNLEKQVVLMPKVSVEARYIPEQYRHTIDLLPLVAEYGIVLGYFVEIIASNVVLETDDEKRIIPICPNEIASDCDYNIKDVIEEEIEILRNVGRSYETIGVLHHKGLEGTAEDFREAIIRFETHDYEGAIKFFRKVMEGLRSFTRDNVIGTKNRTDAIRDFLSKTYHLMSNFGEHAGTRGSLEEAVLSRDITVAVSQYITNRV